MMALCGYMAFWYLLFALLLCKSVIKIRTIYFHPLNKFPGPKLASISNIWHFYPYLRGQQPYDIVALHQKYGPVVRIAPNELSFNTSQSWKDIYGFRQGHETFVKKHLYDGKSIADKAHLPVSERDPVEHGKMRQYLTQVFSEKALKEQEHQIAAIIDRFVDQIGRKCGDEGVNMVKWFEMMTFDIIGELAFGVSFDSVEAGEIPQWTSLVIATLTHGPLADTMKRFPRFAKTVLIVMPAKIQKLIEDTKVHEGCSIKLVERRIAKKNVRKDFMTRILAMRDPKEVSDNQLAAQVSDFITAGSETTATALACITYYLLRCPKVCEKLQREVRNSFGTYDAIDAASTASLEYLNAVILEGLRICPPLPSPLPRIVPYPGDTVDGHFLPGGTVVSTNPIATSLSPTNFEDPETFRPERWLGTETKDRLDASQAFSLGPRGCMGRSLAWMKMRTTLAKLHYGYDMELLDKDIDCQRDSRMDTFCMKPEMRVRLVAHPARRDSASH